jgi:hypothetical protein
VAALNFPSSPSDGDIYGNWTYLASKSVWKSIPLSRVSSITSDTEPPQPVHGDQWFNTLDGTMYIYYTDVDTSQWVEVATPGNYYEDTTRDANRLAAISVTENKIAVVESANSTQNSSIFSLGGTLGGMAGYRYIRNTDSQIDTAGRTTGTSWTIMWTGDNRTGYKAGSLIHLRYHIPLRNDDTSWGGGYVEPQITYNNSSTWYKLGSSGYDGGVMAQVTQVIGSYNNSIYINPSLDGVYGDFSVRIRFVSKAYSSTLQWNQSHEINNVSGTGTTSNAANYNQHYASFSTLELALV